MAALDEEELRIISESLEEYLHARREYNRFKKHQEIVEKFRKNK